MGLDVSTSLVVGVPLLNLGSIQEQTEQKSLVDALGNPTGRSVTLKRGYFVTLNGGQYLIASNEQNIADRWYSDRTEYFYHLLVDEDEEEEYESGWFHQSDHNGGPEQVVIGLSPESIKGPELGRHESFDAVRIETIQDLLPKVKGYLNNRFGYTGDVYIISQTNYSY